jgi:hypothetical protein
VDSARRAVNAIWQRGSRLWLVALLAIAVGGLVVLLVSLTGRSHPAAAGSVTAPSSGRTNSPPAGGAVIAGAPVTTPSSAAAQSPAPASQHTTPAGSPPSSTPTSAPASSGGGKPAGLALTPASGATTATPTWATTKGCPSSYQGSAQLFELNTDGTVGSIISPTVPNVASPFGGTLLATVGRAISLGSDVTPGGTIRWVVACAAGPGGTEAKTYLDSIYVTLSADGSSYTSSASPPSG